MAKFELDNVQESKYINEEGKYTLKIYGVAKDENGNTTQLSANKQTEFHKYLCKTKEGEEISVTLYCTANSMWKYKAFLSAVGVDVTGFVLDTETFDPETLIGKRFVGEVRRCPDKINIETGQPEPSKYFEVVKFFRES